MNAQTLGKSALGWVHPQRPSQAGVGRVAADRRRPHRQRSVHIVHQSQTGSEL